LAEKPSFTAEIARTANVSHHLQEKPSTETQMLRHSNSLNRQLSSGSMIPVFVTAVSDRRIVDQSSTLPFEIMHAALNSPSRLRRKAAGIFFLAR